MSSRFATTGKAERGRDHALAEALHRAAIGLLRGIKAADQETGLSPPRLSALILRPCHPKQWRPETTGAGDRLTAFNASMLLYETDLPKERFPVRRGTRSRSAVLCYIRSVP